MDQATKAKFVLALHKHSLHALDSGGGVVGGGGSGGVLPSVAGAFTTQNTFNANSPTAAATVGAQQASLAGQLQNEAAGNGPNPAQIQYEQNAQKIAQQQAGNYAANRALNPGLAARMAGNVAANVGQQAAGGAAAQQAEQQLAAQQQMEGLTAQEQQGVLYSQGLNAQTAQNNTNSVNKTEGGLLNGIGGVVSSLFAKGGMVRKMADGGNISAPNVPNFSNASQESSSQGGGSSSSGGPTSGVGQILSGILGGSGAAGGGAGAGSLADAAPAASLLAAKGGKVSAPNAKEKARVKDDSLKNDKIPALLSEGEIVIPRHISEHPQAAQKAAAFVQAVINKRKMGKT